MCSYRLHEAMDSLEKVEVIVVLDGVDMPDHPKAMSWSEFVSKGESVEDSRIRDSIQCNQDNKKKRPCAHHPVKNTIVLITIG